MDKNKQTENSLTRSQSQVLSFIKTRYQSTGVSPSYREIQENFGYSAIGTVQDHVRGLLKKGAVERVGGSGNARGLIPSGYRLDGVRQIPVYGEIAAGATREAEQIKLGTVVVSDSEQKGASFALRVVGNSMVEAGILEGDFVIVERGARIQNGDIVVALLNGETTVKRYQKKGKSVWLVPENKEMSPIVVTTGDLEIQGKVVGLQRRL